VLLDKALRGSIEIIEPGLRAIEDRRDRRRIGLSDQEGQETIAPAFAAATAPRILRGPDATRVPRRNHRQ
jgi:hypothetical protein